MKAKELKAILQEIPDDFEIVFENVDNAKHGEEHDMYYMNYDIHDTEEWARLNLGWRAIQP